MEFFQVLKVVCQGSWREAGDSVGRDLGEFRGASALTGDFLLSSLAVPSWSKDD